MPFRGFTFVGTDADLTQETREHAEEMARKQAHAADLARAILLVKGRC